MRELAFQEHLDTLFDAATALRMALIGPIEVGELLSRLLAPTSFWPDDLDPAEWPRTTVLNQYLEGIADSSIWGGHTLAFGMDDSAFSSSLDLADRTTQGILLATDAVLCQGLLGANSKAWGMIQGIVQWSDSVALSAGAFLAWFCQDLLDRLDQQRSTVLQARERLNNYRRDTMNTSPTPESEPDSHDPQEYDSGVARIFAEVWLETFPMKSQK